MLSTTAGPASLARIVTTCNANADKLVQVLKDLAVTEQDKVGTENELKSVSKDVSELSKTVSASALALTVLEAAQGTATGATKILQGDMANIKSRLTAVEKQLLVIAKKVDYVPETCAHLQDKPANGTVSIIGDHGGRVPVSVCSNNELRSARVHTPCTYTRMILFCICLLAHVSIAEAWRSTFHTGLSRDRPVLDFDPAFHFGYFTWYLD